MSRASGRSPWARWCPTSTATPSTLTASGPSIGKDWEQHNADFLASADTVNHAVKLFSISVGDKDFLLAGSKSLAEVLDKHAIKHEVHISGGGHTWINWRHYLTPHACSSKSNPVKPGPAHIARHGPWRSAGRMGSKDVGVPKKLPLADFGVFCKVPSPGIRQGKSESGHFFESAPRSDRAILGMRHSFPPSIFLSRSVEPRS